ncbi:MAG: response regulator transcription factor [Proteobacteria bacterium]|nr:response regulator transcription factor [Pseudomonadota bacterium]
MGRTILIADDHPLFRAALRGAVAGALPDAEFVEADSVAAVLEAIERHPQADVLLLDLDMPGAHGFSALAHVRGSRPELPVVIVSATADAPTVANAFSYGAQGFIAKSADAAAIGAGVEAVLQGELVAPPDYRAPAPGTPGSADLEVAARLAELTPQQFRVLSMLLSGLLNKQIAFELDVSEATVKAHVTAVLRKLGVANRTQAVLRVGRLAIDHGALRAAPEEAD